MLLKHTHPSFSMRFSDPMDINLRLWVVNGFVQTESNDKFYFEKIENGIIINEIHGVDVMIVSNMSNMKMLFSIKKFLR